MRMNGTTEGIGFYFTDNQSIAKGYADKGDAGKLYEVYLNISKPLNIDSKPAYYVPYSCRHAFSNLLKNAFGLINKAV